MPGAAHWGSFSYLVAAAMEGARIQRSFSENLMRALVAEMHVLNCVTAAGVGRAVNALAICRPRCRRKVAQCGALLMRYVWR